MMEPRVFPFGGIPVYNPQSLSKTEALAQFHVRQAAYLNLIDMLRQDHPSHVLIIGTRGMGKTTLLQRVRYGVEDDSDLNSRYLVLAFPEEQYNVNRLHHFLLNTVDALADAMERLQNKPALDQVEAYADMVGKCTQEEIEGMVPKFLSDISQQMRKGFLLLVDNADRLFETIENTQQWRLREMLSSRRDMTFFGATTQASDGIHEPTRAFFEFFQIQRLGPLTLAEVRDLLLRLSESVEEKEGEKGNAKRRVAEWLDADAARLRTLVQLTGGNPRTTVLLFHLVLDSLAGGAREYLEQLLDQVTPNYKGRVDELPAQAQQVLDAVALKWDPVTAMEIAEDTGLETPAVSTQLTRLVRQGILEKADPGDSKKALYQVAERFFNIWYLMRASRRVRAKLRWFVEFLRVFFDSPELEKMAWDRIDRYQSTWIGHPEEIETAFAYVLASRAGREKVEDYLRQMCAESETLWRPYLELMEFPVVDETHAACALSETISGINGDGAVNTEVGLRRTIEAEPDNAEHWVRLGRFLATDRRRAEEAEASYRKAIAVDPKSVLAWSALGLLLMMATARDWEAEAAIRTAIELRPTVAVFWYILGTVLAKVPERRADAEIAFGKATELDPSIAMYWNCLGDLLVKLPDRIADAETAYRKAIALDPKISWIWNGLGDLLVKLPGRIADSETAYRKAIELDPKVARFWNNLGDLLADTSARTADAEMAFRKAIQLDPNLCIFWINLGDLLAKAPERSVDAEMAYRKAIELDPMVAGLWFNLGSLLANAPERIAEAEVAYRKAIELDPNRPAFWNNLGVLLTKTSDRIPEQEAAYRRAIDLDPRFAISWHNLGNLLAKATERIAEAEVAYRMAIDLNPTEARSWGALGIFLACSARRPKDAEIALREAVRLEPSNFGVVRNLGVLLYCELAEPKEAATFLRRAQPANPGDAISAAILAAIFQGLETRPEESKIFVDAATEPEFWDQLLDLCRNYPPFGKILLGICDLVRERDPSNRFVTLYRAVAHAQLGDFPRATVALEDALTGDPIDLLSIGQRALELCFAAAIKHGRVSDCIALLDKKEWKDAWRPIYEGLKAVEAGSAVYLKRIAVEIRQPALVVLRRIAPKLPDLPKGGR